jgi:hypothetical protein
MINDKQHQIVSFFLIFSETKQRDGELKKKIIVYVPFTKEPKHFSHLTSNKEKTFLKYAFLIT